MNIQKISSISNSYYSKKSTSQNNNNQYTNINPIKSLPNFAYKDFNITFKGGRTPEDFYRQDFNVNGMPQTMRAYLNEDYEDRQFMPPAQIMRTVFNDIKYLDNLDEVKEVYSDEPLFKKLHQKPSRKTRTIREIELMSEDGKTPFKNSNDNLGMYLLKKIYIEGKTFDEIKKDFNKDLSVHYKGISPLDYNTLYAYGINYPDSSFWHSYIATRDDYTINHKPRKKLESRLDSKKIQQKEQKPRFSESDIGARVLKDMTDAIIKGHGSTDNTRRNLQKRGMDSADKKLTFLQQYLKPIMIVALEKAHASEEMKDFFTDYETKDISQKNKLDAYWKRNPYMREIQSQAISDTIKLFFLTYGADGNNEEFQDLLDYANSIKPKREENQKIHDQKQLYYEEIFKDYDYDKIVNEQTNNEIPETNNKKSKKVSVEFADLSELPKDLSKDLFEYVVNGKKVKINAMLDDSIKVILQNRLKILPSAFINKFATYNLNHPLATQDFKIGVLLDAVNSNENLPFDQNDIISQDKIVDTQYKIYKDFESKYKTTIDAAIQATVDTFYKESNDIENTITLFNQNFGVIAKLSANTTLAEAMINNSKYLNDRYNYYNKPLTNKELIKISNEIIEKLRNYEFDKSKLNTDEKGNDYNLYISALSILVRNKYPESKKFKTDLYDFVRDEIGGNARFLLDDFPTELKMAKAEEIIVKYGLAHPKEFANYISSNQEVIDFIKEHDTKSRYNKQYNTMVNYKKMY